ncbi:hypothetical protein IMG5_097260 [Ichthyophthirius multifiliis]|uniref:Glutamate dehydrogenase n=1 Tax=Ichthyophthirius multifiliis TaxID=5932 RepID=G0QRS6_ICHMU|nr:hypothetical protein IMG5_097260 [Ichthyophthirius multifiliis]EGR32060.1 hypothetical protein IMG5_097260 [Ichthyophthirius multifiliis]|eukprot:XP_004035546.1 hypothetical protein IMG5_097260 [Ichthyophthirius multifiliis]
MIIKCLRKPYYNYLLNNPLYHKTKSQQISKPGTKSGTIDYIVYKYMDQAASYTNIDQEKIKFYKSCDNTLEITIPLIRKNGKLEIIKGYRTQHKTYKLPTRGGLIINKNITKEDIEAFACLNSIRAVALNMPHGGAKGAICINPKDYTDNEIETIIRKYIVECGKKGIIGSSIDIPGTDLGSTEREMNWIKDTYTFFYGQDDIDAQACATGKSLNQGGLNGALQSSGFCVYFTIQYLLNQQEFCQKAGITQGIKGKKFIVEGYGNVGYWASKFLQEAGGILIGVIEHDGECYNEQGIDAQDINDYLLKNKGIKGYSKAKAIKDVAFQKCDIFIPSYFAKAIYQQIADKFQCKIVAEAANLSVTPNAEKILESKGIQIIPDVICSSGGFLAGYFEWIKNINHTQSHGSMTRKWEYKSNIQLLETIEEETGLKIKQELSHYFKDIQGANEQDLVFSGLQEGFESALNACIETQNKYLVNLRQAVYINALKKIDEHYKQVGITFGK